MISRFIFLISTLILTNMLIPSAMARPQTWFWPAYSESTVGMTPDGYPEPGNTGYGNRFAGFFLICNHCPRGR
ncbi:hypothetical protein Ddc_11948 [Ditylenchus destructor]|nr:hypothetical protein Ddc_20695 [Ditylenchus destructor]KAI1713394.1 hypothetical protein Ddc_11948 [Ditylenchus destructor]